MAHCSLIKKACGDCCDGQLLIFFGEDVTQRIAMITPRRVQISDVIAADGGDALSDGVLAFVRGGFDGADLVAVEKAVRKAAEGGGGDGGGMGGGSGGGGDGGGSGGGGVVVKEKRRWRWGRWRTWWWARWRRGGGDGGGRRR